MREKLPTTNKDYLEDHEFPAGETEPKKDPENWTVETAEKKLSKKHKIWITQNHLLILSLTNLSATLYFILEAIPESTRETHNKLIAGTVASSIGGIFGLGIWLKNRYDKKS